MIWEDLGKKMRKETKRKRTHERAPPANYRTPKGGIHIQRGRYRDVWGHKFSLGRTPTPGSGKHIEDGAQKISAAGMTTAGGPIACGRPPVRGHPGSRKEEKEYTPGGRGGQGNQG